jgi:hypothetical protein
MILKLNFPFKIFSVTKFPKIKFGIPIVYKRQKDVLLYLVMVLFFLIAQIVFWLATEKIKPDLQIVPEVPTASLLKAFSLGDDQFSFRSKANRIQFAGDTFGRFSAFKDYNYEKLGAWFNLLDTLDDRSDYVPSMAAYYYSATQNKKDTIHIAKYLENHADNYLRKKQINPKEYPNEQWWWYYQASYFANREVKDKQMAMRLAVKLKENSPPDAPDWTKKMPDIILRRVDGDCETIKIIFGAAESIEDHKISNKEINYMGFYLKQKMDEIKKKYPTEREFNNFYRKCLE